MILTTATFRVTVSTPGGKARVSLRSTREADAYHEAEEVGELHRSLVKPEWRESVTWVVDRLPERR